MVPTGLPALARDMQDGVRVAGMLLQFLDGLHRGQDHQFDFAALGFALHFSHDRQSARSSADHEAGKAHLLFLQRSQLMAQPFDAGTAAVSGEPVSITEPLQNGPSFSTSENGVLISAGSGRPVPAHMVLPGGQATGNGRGCRQHSLPPISPDQKAVAFHQVDGMSFDIWLFDLERGNSIRFTLGPDRAAYPIWSPDGSRIAYSLRKPDENLIVERLVQRDGKADRPLPLPARQLLRSAELVARHGPMTTRITSSPAPGAAILR